MLTQIEIDGFKTFKDFKVELAPFQVIVGPNGSGKSNLFDALHLLSRLASMDLQSAFQNMRGDIYELFTTFPNGKLTDRIRMVVEMLVDRTVQDRWGKHASLEYRRLRYELEIAYRTDEYGLERLYIARESLRSISQDEDGWSEKYGIALSKIWLASPTTDRMSFITTSDPNETGKPTIYLYVEEHPFEQRGDVTFQAEVAQGTVLSWVTSTVGFPHAFAAGEEFRSLKFLHLNPEVLRQSSSVKAPAFLATDGSNLPTTLARMQAEDQFAFHCVSLDMANLVPGILEIEVEKDQAGNEYRIHAKTSDQRSFSSQVLSDGTLRLLALATLRNDSQFHGVLCLEEPENGVQPLHLKNMAHLLREMATDFNDLQRVDEPLRQVLITTHSPMFISLPEAIDSLLLAIMLTRVQGKSAPAIQVTRMVPVITPNTLSQLEMETNRDKAVEAYTIDMIRKYLDSGTLDEALNQLKKARTSLNER